MSDAAGRSYDWGVSQERNTEAQRLFDELIELDPTARELRLLKLAPDPTVSREVTSLLAAAERAGDFLGVLGATSAPETKRPAPGPLVAARYRLERALGSGSMGDVHLAWDQQLERPVALKFLRASSHADPSALPRFIAEARAAARLDHPHVATVHDFGETEQRQLFIAMAYYPGETLRDRIARGPLPAADALRIAAQIASALGAAHAAGIVHRDVKPANVLIDAEGAVKLTDFGIAKLSAEHDTTSPGVAVGTLAYMSPEQARGDAVDSRTDLWSLGVVLHEMIAGRRPFIGDNAAALVHALIHGDPAPLPEGDAQVGPALRALVAALLSKDPERRPDRASTVRQALERLAAGDDALPTRAAPGAGALPQAMTGFIGREREIALARGLLDDTRLLTLTGPGGTGKTRLALQLAASVRERHADGVWFVPLAEISDADLVPSMVAQTLGVRDLGATLLSDRVIAALRGKQILLVLDNFEHVLDAGAFVARLLGACPGVTVMATSRAPLAVQGEQEFPVPPLTTPSRADENAADSEAVRLFVQRARAVRPGFALDEAALDAVGEICRRLDGLPLALELAAARAKLLSPRAMLARLEHRFDLLRADARDRPARHSTMRAVIDWSYVLLTDAERALFDRLAVFAGGISVDAAEAVAPSRDGGTDAPPAVLDVLDSLCNKSLLRQDDQADGEPRFVMLETVREFGLERLRDSRGEAAARRAHRAYCIALAERAAGELRGPAQAAWFDRLEHEYANFRVALD
ncbi:MAG TPA: protein kinase, partial [Candidatus Elarobacter sp.]|nr:protein kinase [Candidatus Elarobacter sp.]